MNHFIAAYLVPIVKAKGMVNDVSLQVLNDTNDTQLVQTGGLETQENKSTMTVMDKKNIQKILDIQALGEDNAAQGIPRRAEEIMRTMNVVPEESDERFKMLEFLNSLSNK